MGRRSRSILVLVLLLTGTLAGCTDSDDDKENGGSRVPPPPAPPGGGSGDEGARLAAAGARPVWFLGLEWTFAVTNTRLDVQGDLVLAVVAETADVWQLAPAEGSDPDVVKWSLFAHLPPLGPVSKGSLAPHIHGQEVQMFDFPLRDGKTWSAQDASGRNVDYVATATETTLFEGSRVPAFEVLGSRDGAPWLRYVYSSGAAFFVEAGLDANGDGTYEVTVKMTDARASDAYQTTPTFEPVDVASLNDEGLTSILDPATGFTVPAEATDLYVYFIMGGGPGRYTGSVTLPQGGIKSFNFTNTNQTDIVVIRGARYDAVAGEGNVGSLILGEGFVRAELIAIVRNGP